MVEKRLFVPRLLVVALIPLVVGYIAHLIMLPAPGADGVAQALGDEVYSYPPFAALLTLGLLLYAIRSVRQKMGIIGHGDTPEETGDES